MAERTNPMPPGTYGPFPGDMPEADRFAQPRPDHQDLERRQSGGLSDAPDDTMPVRPVGPVPYSPSRLR